MATSKRSKKCYKSEFCEFSGSLNKNMIEKTLLNIMRDTSWCGGVISILKEKEQDEGGGEQRRRGRGSQDGEGPGAREEQIFAESWSALVGSQQGPGRPPPPPRATAAADTAQWAQSRT